MPIQKMCSRINSQTPPPTNSLASTTAPFVKGDVKQNILGASINSECADVDSLKHQISNVLVKTESRIQAEMEKKTSPSKADNTAVEPSESAHMVNLVNGETLLNGAHVMKGKADEPVNSVLQKEMNNNSATTSRMVETEKVDPSKSTSEKLITSDILQEEQQLQQNSIEAEEKLKNEQEEYWKNTDEISHKMRYQRLQVLLEKCNAYTQYLLQRMKRQEEEEARNKKLMTQIKARQDRRREEKLKWNKQPCETVKAENEDQSSACFIQSKKKRPLPDTTESPDCKKSKLSDAEKECNRSEAEKTVNEDVDQARGFSEDFEDPSLDESTNALYNRKINGESVPMSQPLLFVGGVLRPYQIDGYNWLKMLYENGVNGILADEMGLGKTVQCIALVSHLASMGVKGPFLICAPLSTIPNWVAEFERFTPQLPVILYHGDRNTRSTLRKKMLKLKKLGDNVFVLPVIITSYEIIMNDRKLLSHIKWKYLIVDEGQRIKNTHCRLIRELRLYNTTHRLLLTGTPLQNSLSELWSLLNFLLPELFDDLRSFESWFDIERISQQDANEEIMATEQKDHILSMLHQILTPFMLRRLKSDVELVIPPKKEIIVFCPLTKLQQTFYKATLNNTIENLLDKKMEVKVEVDVKGRPVRQSKKHISYKHVFEGSTTEKKTWSDRDEKQLMNWINNVIESNTKRDQERASKSSPAPNSRVNLKMNNIMMMLRKICNHPYLIEHPLDPKTGELVLNNDLIKHSGKMGMLDRMLPELKKNGHKLLIFSQFVQVLNILEDYCYLKNFEYSRLDGSYGFEQRQEQIDTFNNDKNTFLFLLSTRAGGLGINLVAADTVIIFDSDWNPQCDLQAQDRCHRIGQVKPVVVYRLVSRNTIDQKIVERATAKRKLEKMIIHKGKFKCGIKNFSTSLTSMSPQELRELLQSSDHEEIYEGGNRSSIISQSDLEKMLDRTDLIDKLEESKKGHKKKVLKKMSCKEIEGVFRVIETDENPTKLSNITDLKGEDSNSKSSNN